MFNKGSFANLDNDYNVLFLPNTQYIKLKLDKKSIRFISSKENEKN